MWSRGVRSVVIVALAASCAGQAEPLTLSPAALSVSDEILEFGDLVVGQEVSREVSLTNTGEVALGIESMVLDEASADFELSVDCETWAAATSCLVQPGQTVVATVGFTSADRGSALGSLRITTAGDQDPAGPVDVDGVFGDSTRTWQQVGLRARVLDPNATVEILSGGLDLGYVVPRERSTQPLAVINHTDDLVDVKWSMELCDAGFSLALPDTSTPLGREESLVGSVTYVAPEPAQDASCQFTVAVRRGETGDWDTTTLLATVDGLSTAPGPFAVTIVSPEPPVRVDGTDPLPMRIAFENAGGPLTDLWCKIRSARQGAPDGRPAIASCTPTDESGFVEVDLPLDFYLSPGPEVIWVEATTTHGVTARASLPLLLSVDPAPDDLDGDGYGTSDEPSDCDDTNVDAHPLAIERADGVDDDCDGEIDEDTAAFDSDGDGWSPADGDCDDRDPQIYPGASEQRDGRDNDCDGRVDEHTTNWDDDGDGTTELEGDCNDRDPAVGPHRVELCDDAIDNDCDRQLDDNDPDGCVRIDHEPALLGTLWMSANVVEVGDTVDVHIVVGDPDGPPPEVEWDTQAGAIVSTDGDRMTWQAPDRIEPESAASSEIALYVTARDVDGNEAWAGELVRVVPAGTLDARIEVPTDTPTAGCSTHADPAGPWALLLGLLALRRRRP